MLAVTARRLARRAVVSAVGGLAVAGVLTAPAAAEPPNGDDATVHAAGVMLVPNDLPAPIRAGRRHSFGSDTAVLTSPFLCNLKTRTVTLPDVLQSSSSDVFGFRHRAMSQDVYDYGSVGAAGAAWNALVRRLERCDRGATRVSTGRMTVSVVGQTGRWIRAGSPAGTRSFTTWVVVGTTIQSVEYAVPWRQRLAATQRRAVEALASSLAARWIEVDTPVVPAAG